MCIYYHSDWSNPDLILQCNILSLHCTYTVIIPGVSTVFDNASLVSWGTKQWQDNT